MHCSKRLSCAKSGERTEQEMIYHKCAAGADIICRIAELVCTINSMTEPLQADMAAHGQNSYLWTVAVTRRIRYKICLIGRVGMSQLSAEDCPVDIKAIEHAADLIEGLMEMFSTEGYATMSGEPGAWLYLVWTFLVDIDKALDMSECNSTADQFESQLSPAYGLRDIYELCMRTFKVLMVKENDKWLHVASKLKFWGFGTVRDSAATYDVVFAFFPRDAALSHFRDTLLDHLVHILMITGEYLGPVLMRRKLMSLKERGIRSQQREFNIDSQTSSEFSKTLDDITAMTSTIDLAAKATKCWKLDSITPWVTEGLAGTTGTSGQCIDLAAEAARVIGELYKVSMLIIPYQTQYHDVLEIVSKQ